MANKNLGPFQYFTTDWFRQHQRPLLYLLNNPMTKFLARYLMRIRPGDIPLREPILRIRPNGFLWGKEPNGDYHFDLRCHHKFAKRLYYAGKPLWSLMHAFDMRVANPFIPAWNLGFDAFPSEPYYPEEGHAGATVDGNVDYTSATSWHTCCIATTAANAYPDAANFTLTQAYTTFKIARAIITINISAITGTVTAGTLSLYGNAKLDNGTYKANVCLVTSAPTSANNVVVGDIDPAKYGTTLLAPIKTVGDFSTTAYNDFVLNAAGIAALNTALSGDKIMKFGTRPQYDGGCDTEQIPDAGSYAQAKAADTAGTTTDPKLTGTYTPASSYGGMMF